jgi:hypothetical protein
VQSQNSKDHGKRGTLDRFRNLTCMSALRSRAREPRSRGMACR